MQFVKHFIDGLEVESAKGGRFESVNPTTQMPWSEVALGDRDDVTAAIMCARRAFMEGPWSRMGFEGRGKILHRLADLVDEHCQEFAECEAKDMGKPISEARSLEVPRSAANFRFFADYAALGQSEALPTDGGHLQYVRYEPAGVVAAIAPWNLPLMLGSWKVAPALAWGNTVVLKPSEFAPSSSVLLARLAAAAGMPAGVLNVVHGYGARSVGQFLTESSEIGRITFTGEAATGKAIAQAAARNLTPISLELGGKGANLVFADADLDSAVPLCVRSTFSNAGQICLAGSRVYVQAALFDEFLERFVSAACGLLVGDPMKEETDVGPLSSGKHYAKVIDYLERIESEGGTILTGGAEDGWYVRPTVAVDVPKDSRIWQEEVFGPIATVSPFETEEEAVAWANGTPYGLNTMIYTEDLRRAHRVSARLRVGTVWVNCFQVRDLRAPFGGVGLSGIGREGGDHSRAFFTDPKAVVIQP